MGFGLSILYLVTYYLTPATLFGPLAPYHVEIILAGLICLVSLPAIGKSFVFKTPQSLALVGVSLAVFLSMLIGDRWASGAVVALLGFIPNALAYFLVCLHCRSTVKLRILILMLLFVCVFVIARGFIDLQFRIPVSSPPTSAVFDSDRLNPWNIDHPFQLPMRNNTGEWFYRLRGEGEISDPNDFGQLTVCLIPLVFFFWRPKRTVSNIAFVIVPASVLVFGMYLTHSRGSIVALAAVALVAARRRIGTLPALVMTGGLFIAASVLHVAGGREISSSAGSDRTGLWGQGLEMLKSQPLFGVGYGHFAEKSDVGLTAHNSIVVCAAELGLFGLFFWALFLLPTLRDAIWTSQPANVSGGEPSVNENRSLRQQGRKTATIDKTEVNRLGSIMVLSLTGFLVQGMFLSRAFVLTLFLLGGMAEVVYEIALARGMVAPRLRIGKALWCTGGLTFGLVLGMYVMLRIMNLLH